MKRKFYSNGKLLLTGEYAVLDGAKALAVPTKFGQSLKITPTKSGKLKWKSFDADKRIWFEAQFSLPSLKLLSSTDIEVSKTLLNILTAVREINNEFLDYESGVHVETLLTFPKDWGLGTSSTLINNIADWASVDPYLLLENTFGGSGYDIACAQYETPLVYHLADEGPEIEAIKFQPSFSDQIYFVYLNQKQNSREAIRNYRVQTFNKKHFLKTISAITTDIVNTDDIEVFEKLVQKHEATLSKVLNLPPVQKRLFPDYFGAMKSLGGWGGDFVMATGNEKTPDYFKAKGFDTIIPFKDLVL
ncbi:GYDIA family GHMP kinase [uncultured Croceitalea sp.]|uniref:GYDIA family GHMP kinase n=1 Tax=uncultured Croceitalea sp. TaxID=1798908 RepID=UPI0033058BBA